MAQNVKEFYQEFMQSVREEATNNGTSSEQQLTNFALEYIMGDGLADRPYIVNCNNDKEGKIGDSNYFKLTAFDYSEDTGVLDLFTTCYFESDIIPEMKKTHQERTLNWLMRFFNRCVESDSLLKRFEEEDPDIAELIATIKFAYQEKNISQIRFFSITNGIIKDDKLEISEGTKITSQDICIEFIAWDIEATYRSEMASQYAGAIDIDLQELYGQSIECLHLDEGSGVKSYLAIMPAIILAKVYGDYKARLLNQNVRTYLGGNIKVNKKMAKTLKEKPEMFFAYNNGISSTATSVVTKNEEGRCMITNIKNWQIVNGGQTTNTIYSSYKKDKQSLNGVYITLKISEIIIEDETQKMNSISQIANFANSQTQIKDSDLCANHEYMLLLDKQAQNAWTPVNSSRKNTQWFFERMRGQYDMCKGTPRSASAKKFILEHPKEQSFTKVDIAKTEMAWARMPYASSLGREKCFMKFWKEFISKNQYDVNEKYFHDLVAKLIIYETIKKEFKKADMKGYCNLVCNYVLAIISAKSHEKFDLDYIWNHQEVNPLLIPFIQEAMDCVNKYILKISSEGINPTVAAKRLDFWNAIQLRVAELNLNASLFEVGTTQELSSKDKEKLAYFKSIELETWQRLTEWGKQTKLLSLLERKKLDHSLLKISAEKEVPFNVVVDMLRLLEKAKDLKFE